MKVERCDRCMGLARETELGERGGRCCSLLRCAPLQSCKGSGFFFTRGRSEFLSDCKMTLDKYSEQQKTSLASDEIAPYENEQCSLHPSQSVNALWRVSNDVHACTILAGGTRSFGGFDLFSYNAIHLIANFPLWAVNLAGGIPYK